MKGLRMELKVSEFSVPSEIGINYEELKNEVAVKMADYKDLVYTDAEVPKAKKDLATMRKFIKALDEARKDVKAELLKPYVDFERKVNEIKALVEEPICLIDKQVKNYDDAKRSRKARAIADYYNGLENKPPVNILAIIADPQWENASYSMTQIRKEIDDSVKDYYDGTHILSALTKFRFEAMEEFNRTLSLAKALEKQNELLEQAERKKALSEEDASPRTWVAFEALMNKSETKLLKEFFEVNEIEIRPITKGETK